MFLVARYTVTYVMLIKWRNKYLQNTDKNNWLDITDNKCLETQKLGICSKTVAWSTLPTEGNPINATLASPDFITSNPSPFVQHYNQTVSLYSNTCQLKPSKESYTNININWQKWYQYLLHVNNTTSVHSDTTSLIRNCNFLSFVRYYTINTSKYQLIYSDTSTCAECICNW